MKKKKKERHYSRKKISGWLCELREKIEDWTKDFDSKMPKEVLISKDTLNEWCTEIDSISLALVELNYDNEDEG